MEASQGLSAITGYQDGLPDKAGQSFIDFVACWSGLFAVASALRYRNRTGKGQWIDLGMYQLGAYLVSDYVMDFMHNKRISGRIGNRHAVHAPQGCYPCKGDDRWCVLSVRDDDEWSALCRVMGKPQLADDSRFADPISRMRNHDELDSIIGGWSRGLDRFEMMHTLQDAGVPSGAVFDAKDTNMSDHYWERGFEEKVTWPPERGMGTRVLMGRPWKLSKAPLRITEGVHTLGQDNGYVLQDLLGREDSQMQDMEDSQMIGDTPIAARRGPLQPPPARGTRAAGAARFPAWYDPDYKKLLDI
jgi:benzylsuccinate CoA-transferase BbsF subunit